MLLDDKPGMLKLISLVVNDPHVTALTVVKDSAVTAPPTVADDALRGPHTMSPCNVVFCLIECYTVRGIYLDMACQTKRREI